MFCLGLQEEYKKEQKQKNMEEKRPASLGTLTGNIGVSDSIEHSLYTD